MCIIAAGRLETLSKKLSLSKFKGMHLRGNTVHNEITAGTTIVTVCLYMAVKRLHIWVFPFAKLSLCEYIKQSVPKAYKYKV